MAEVIFDTNVPVVANGLAGQASGACVEACIDRLLASQGEDVVCVDEGGLIFDEYQRYLAHRGQPGAGDAFFK
jgi:malic enzyme